MEMITLYVNGSLITIPKKRLIESWAAELGMSIGEIEPYLNHLPLTVKEIHVPFLRGDIFSGTEGAPASLVRDTYIHSENWTILQATRLVNMSLTV